MLNKLSLKWLLLALVVLVAALPLTAALAQEATPETPAAEAGAEGAPAEEGAAPEEGEAPAEAGEEETAAVSPLTPLGINAGYLIAQIINFSLIAVVLGLFLWRPLVNMLDTRAARIQKGLEDAAVAANARRNAEAEAERVLAGARADVARAVEEGRVRGEEIAKQIEAEARTEAERIRNEARLAAETERNQQLAELRGQVANVSVAIAQRLIGASLVDSKNQGTIINDFFAKLPANAHGLNGAVEVTSAMPLTDAEQARVKSELGASDVTFRVDPGILGGLVVRAGDRVIDGSVRSGLNELSGRLV